MSRKFHEFIGLCRVLTFYKIVNAIWVWFHFQLSKKTKWSNSLGYPISMSIEPTTACNLGCPECPSGLKKFNRPIGNLKLNDFEIWIKDWSRHLIYLNFYFQGEPFIHPQLLTMIELAKRNRIYTAISTNGHFLTTEVVDEVISVGLDRIIISMDGYTQEVYEQYRVRGSVELVKQGVQRLVEKRKECKSALPYIILQTLVVKPNEDEVDQICTWAKEIGVDEVKLKTAQLYDPKDDHPLMPSNPEYSRYKKRNGKWEIKNELLDHCWRLWSGCVVTWDGRVVPCCFDKDAKYEMGSLKDSSLKEIWQNSIYQSFRKKVLLSRKEVDICANCSEGTKVWT
jgi:radical SAM protein with 4Fe4S-binding SPASM domain